MKTLETYQSINDVGCILCGEDLNKLDKQMSMHCDFCGQTQSISYFCKNEHSICDSCLKIAPEDFVKKICLKHKGIDPNALAVEIMNSPVITMHGSVHHFIVPAVLLTCVYNLEKKTELLSSQLDALLHRVFEETPDACQYHNGTCGAAQGASVFLSVYLNRNQNAEDEWSPSNTLTAECLRRIADHGGPRCCKRDTYFSIAATVDYMKESFALELPISEAKCTFSLRNKSCGREECAYYNLANSLV